MKTIEERIAKWKFIEGHIGAFVVRIEDAEEIAEEYAEEYAKAFLIWTRNYPLTYSTDTPRLMELFKESLKK